MGSKLGVLKLAAKKCGISLEQYREKTAQNLKRCTFCEEWRPIDTFAADASRWDGRTQGCIECRNSRSRESYDPISDLFRLPYGPHRILRRAGDKEQAKSRINHDVSLGLRPNPNVLHCVKCAHKGTDRRHEYHHVMGYSEMHHYDVLPLCSKCHHEEHPRGHKNKD